MYVCAADILTIVTLLLLLYTHMFDVANCDEVAVVS